MTQGTQSWCSVKTWREWGGVGGGRGVQDRGNTCMPMADSY